MHNVSLIIGKFVFVLLRLFGRTGSALPGLVVEKLDRRFLPAMLAKLPEGTIIVSGTNGKTTTTKITAELLEGQGLRVLTNKSGSNFVRGIISVIVDKADWRGTLPYDIAVFEQDEAHAVHFARRVKPRGVILLNIMRDQMDRFGEIDTTRSMLEKLAASASDWVVLNANDERIGTIAKACRAPVHWYGHSETLHKDFLTDDQFYHDESTAYVMAARPEVVLTAYDTRSVTITVGQAKHRFETQLRGSHNAINCTAALAGLYQVVDRPDTGSLEHTFAALEPAFGRGEVIALPGSSKATLTIQLVKNPGGFTQALRMLEQGSYRTVGICINDDYADGRDVSWLWDVDFSRLKKHGTVITGGTRAADMTNRLKYNDVHALTAAEDMPVFADTFNETARKSSGNALIFCTYTAMRQLRNVYIGTQSGLDEI